MKAKRFNDGGVSKSYGPYITKEAVDKVLEQAKNFKDDGFGKISPKDAARALGVELSNTEASDKKPGSTKKESGEEMPKMKKGGSVKSSASRRADGCAQRGKTKGRMI